MKLPIAFLVMMGAIKADGIRPPPSANADADDSPVLRTSGPTSTSTTTAADDEDEAHPKTRQTEGYADLATTPGLIGSGGIGECFSRRRLLPSGRTGRYYRLRISIGSRTNRQLQRQKVPKISSFSRRLGQEREAGFRPPGLLD